MAALSSLPATVLRGVFPRFGSVPRASFTAISARPPRSIRHATPTPRIGELIGLNVDHRCPMVFSSGVNSSDPDTGEDKAARRSSNGADGPPLLTILAGVVVLLIVIWVIGSIALWLVGLIVNPPSS